MLTRAVLVLAMASTAAVLVVPPAAARAPGGPAGHGAGGGTGSIQCGQWYTPGCAVSAGDPGSPGAGGVAAQPGPSGGGSAGSGCAGSRDSQFGCVPPGCRVTAGTLGCPLGGGRGAAAPAPGVLAQRARRYLPLPDPVIRSSPPSGVLQLTGLPVWLWIARAAWAPQSRTAAVPGEAVTATAEPVAVTWQMGDGSAVTCPGPGTPFSSRYSPAAPSPDCGHTYSRSSAGQPGGAYPVTATITWDISWRAAGGAAGTLPPLFTTAAAAFRVAESQAINITSGGGS